MSITATLLLSLGITTYGSSLSLKETQLQSEKLTQPVLYEENIVQSSSFYSIDNIEPNDCRDDAHKIDVTFNGNVGDKMINSSLSRSSDIYDIDYYYFNILQKSQVNIEIDFSSYNSNFECIIETYNYYEKKDNNAYHMPMNIAEFISGMEQIKFNRILNCGTYFIYLKGKNFNPSQTFIDYKINLNIRKLVTPNEKIEVNTLRNDKSVLGAVWLHDYIPSRDISLLDFNNMYTYYDRNKQNLNYPDFALDEFLELNPDSKIAEYYIWDPMLRFTLFKVVEGLTETLFDLIDQKEQESSTIELIEGGLDCLNIVLKIAGKVIKVVPVNLGVDLITKVGIPFLKSVFDKLKPKMTLGLARYVDDLSGLRNVLSYGEKIKTYQDLVNNNSIDNTIVMVRLYIEKHIEKIGFIEKNNFSFKCTVDRAPGVNFKYSDEFFYSHTDNIINCGSLYKIEKYDDLLCNGTLSDLFPHQHNFDGHYCKTCGYYLEEHNYVDHYCTYCNKYTEQHDYSHNYKWYNYRQHTSICSCGKTIIEGHIVRGGISGPQKYATCILCKGQAEIGFVNPFEHSINNTNNLQSFILPSGVIVLNKRDYCLFLENHSHFIKN